MNLKMIAMLLLAIGGINWALYGFMDINLVQMLFGSIPMLEKLVYALVGLSAVYSLTCLKGSNCANHNAAA